MYLGLTQFRWIKGQRITVFSDCKPAVGALNKGGSTKSERLQNQIGKIWNWARNKKVKISGHYIKGKRNILADQLSRRNQCLLGEWSLSKTAFEWVLNLGLTPEIDLSASDWSTRLPNYCTSYKSLNTPYMEAFSVNWDQWQVIYLFPPPIMMLKVLNKLKTYKGQALLVFPDWPSAPWYLSVIKVTHKIQCIPFQDLWQGHPDCPILSSPRCWQIVIS